MTRPGRTILAIAISIFYIPRPLQASDDMETLKKIISLQSAEIALLKSEIQKLRSDTDRRFKKLNINVSKSTSFFSKTFDTSGPREESTWDDSTKDGNFTGTHCPDGTVSSGSNWVTMHRSPEITAPFHEAKTNRFSNVYCRTILIKDEGW